MSKWHEQFENHPFQITWHQIKEQIDDCEIEDLTVITSVAELARLNKVIVYIDGIINGLDPELVPISVFTQFKAQADQCLVQINSFIKNRNIGHITNANTHADNLLSYIRPYMLYPGRMKKPLQAAVRNYAKTYETSIEAFKSNSQAILDEILGYREISEVKSGEINEFLEKIKQYSEDIFSENGFKLKLEKLFADAEAKHEAINEYYNETFIDDLDKEEKSTKTMLQEIKIKILADAEALENNLQDINKEVKELQAFYTKIYGDENAKTKKATAGLKKDLDDRLTQLETYEKTQKLRHKELFDQIEELIPGATTAGLAKAYREMRESFVKPAKRWNAFFILIMFIILGVSSFLMINNINWGSSEGFSIGFKQIDNWNTILNNLLLKLPFYIPLIWLAIYSSKRRSEYKRLEQEYAHKETLAKSYNSYKKQIEELGQDDKAMLIKLIDKSIDTIAENSSKTLDKKHDSHTPVEDLVEALKPHFKHIAETAKAIKS